MNVVQVRKVRIGEGTPKICVSIMGRQLPLLIEEIAHLKTLKVDLVEWRLDYYDLVEDHESVIKTLQQIRQNLEEMPLIVTFRTLKEGGQKEIPLNDYVRLYQAIIETQLSDLIDVELFQGETVVKELITFAHQHDVKVIGSNHDFKQTPSKEEIIKRLCRMQDLGADITKVAVMPQNAEDVLTLLLATYEMVTHYATQPVITMSMSKLGLISRLTGNLFGSAITFGANQALSAPGQISADLLYQMLEVLKIE